MKCMSHDMSKTRLSIYQECVVLGAGEPAAWYLEAPSGYPWGGGGQSPGGFSTAGAPLEVCPYSTAQYCTIQHSILKYSSTVQSSTVKHSTVQYSTGPAVQQQQRMNKFMNMTSLCNRNKQKRYSKL